MNVCFPIENKTGEIWTLKEDAPIIGSGVSGTVHLACRDQNCNYVFKWVDFTSSRRIDKEAKNFKREVAIHMSMARSNLAPPIYAHKICAKGTSGGFITKIVDMTIRNYLEDEDTVLDDWERLLEMGLTLLKQMHAKNYYHGDAHIGNFMLEKINSNDLDQPNQVHLSRGYYRMYVIDFGRSDRIVPKSESAKQHRIRMSMTPKSLVDKDNSQYKTSMRIIYRDLVFRGAL